MSACVVVWATAAILTHLPQHYLPDTKFDDFTLHGLAYFVLTLLLWLTLRAYAVAPRRRVLWTAGITICYGMLDEITQPIFGRSAELADWGADAVAAAAAIAVCEMLAYFRCRATSTPD